MPKIGPRRKRKLPPGTVRICFADEAPAIGCGHRLIVVETSGPKWVKIRDVTTGTPRKFPRALWLQIARRAKPVESIR